VELKMRTDIKQIILPLLLSTGVSYSKNTPTKPIDIQSAKDNFFLNRTESSFILPTINYLIKPVSFSYDLIIDFRKVNFKPKR
jgi:hypothetical protein